MKVTIRNLRYQPFTFALGGGGSLHLRSREQKTVAERQISAEVRQAADNGLLDLIPQADKQPGSSAAVSKGRKE